MMTKILVVDDEADLEFLLRQKFRRELRDREFEFLFAVNGVDALIKLQANADIDMILSDINMPEMDGLTLLTKIKEQKPLLKTVIVSAYGDMDNIRIAMNRGAYDFITKPIDFDDLRITINKTIDHTTQIKQTLRAIKENNILKMFVDENVINFMGNHEHISSLHKNETISASVMFVDVCGFTKICEQYEPDVVVQMLNNYFDIIVTTITEYNGSVDKFIGDAVMSVFKGDNHVLRALNASLAIRNRINGMKTNDEEIGFNPNVSIGVNSGEMISGSIGSASLKRFDYTVIGDVVNVAARLQEVALVDQILIPEDIYMQAREMFSMAEVGLVKLKNKSTPLKLYEVLD